MNLLSPTAYPAKQDVTIASEFERSGHVVSHSLRTTAIAVTSRLEAPDRTGDANGDWWKAYLRGVSPTADGRGTVRTVDLFSGPGGLAQGFRQFSDEVGLRVVPVVVADSDDEATRVYAANHGARHRYTRSITDLLDFRVRGNPGSYRFAYPPEIVETEIAEAASAADVVMAGPPCQGHSNLNNSTRRDDPRNQLYLTVPAFAVAADVDTVIIENVPAILNDSSDVVGTAIEVFESEGYFVETGMIKASDLGWPQTRRRHFLIARKSVPPIPLADVGLALSGDPRSVWWAIGDLEELSDVDPLHVVSDLSEENQARVAWLHDNDEYDLALSERPKSHRGGTTYTAVYGRMHKDEPAPTITGGFMSPGRGRFTHPTQRRTISAREAARIQGFPDTYRFITDESQPPTKQKLAKWIGDAVPMPLGYAAALSALGPG